MPDKDRLDSISAQGSQGFRLLSDGQQKLIRVFNELTCSLVETAVLRLIFRLYPPQTVFVCGGYAFFYVVRLLHFVF